MKSVRTVMFRTALALLLGSSALGGPQSTTLSTDAGPPWGNAEVKEITQFKNCTVYGLVTDPEHVYWVVCAPGAALPGAALLPDATTGH